MKTENWTPAQIEDLRIREKMRGWAETDIVAAWFQSEVQFDLTPREDHIRQRWQAARAHFLNLKNYGEVVELLQEEFAISLPQARNDVRNMQRLFGDLERVTKDAHRARAIEMSLKAFRQAETDKDAAGMAAATKIYYLAAALDKEDADKIDMEKLMKERTYVEVIDPTIRNLLLNYIQQSGGVVDVSKLFEKIYEAKNSENYTDYEQLPDDAGTDQE